MTEKLALTVAEAADRVSISRDIISDHCRRSTLPARKIGSRWSIKTADLDEWYEQLPSNQGDL